MLAPVAPSSPLFLAIQNHRTDEIQSLLLTIDYRDSLKLSEGGYSAIHVACRYNNRFALELLLSKGVSIELPDSNGNTPLHYAAKYGHIDIVRLLIDRGGNIAKRNKHNQNPYDVAENHVVRQFMLPLVFAAERNQGGEQQSMDYAPMQQQMSQQPVLQQPQYAVPPPQSTMQAPPPPSSYGAPPPSHSGSGMPSMMNPFQNRNTLPTTGYSNSSSYGAPPAAEGIVPTYSHQTAAAAVAQKPTNIRAIQPDGFHSSASDPELQRKYGHTNIALNIAPPPTDFAYSTAPLSSNGIANTSSAPAAAPAGPQSYYAPPPPGGALSGPPPSSVYNRYVPYDPHTNSAAPLPPVVVPTFTPAAQQQQQQQSTTPPSVLAAASGNRLLGNKSVSGEVNTFSNNAPPVAVNVRPPSQPNNILVFNPATDGEIINLGSSSNSVL